MKYSTKLGKVSKAAVIRAVHYGEDDRAIISGIRNDAGAGWIRSKIELKKAKKYIDKQGGNR